MLAATDKPVGVLFDPKPVLSDVGPQATARSTALVARWRGGEAEEELLAQPAGEPSPIPAAHGVA
jgi:hypothetical protein